MRIAVNALSATAGGGRTYLLNLARFLPEFHGHEFLIFAPAASAGDLQRLPANCRVAHAPWAESNYAARFFWEQFRVSRDVRRWKADVLIAVGNFCPLRSFVPVLLMSRNPLYFTPRFLPDLLGRGHYFWAMQHKVMTELAIRSVEAARLTITPTEAMAGMMRATAGNRPLRLRTIRHGFDLWPGAVPAPPIDPQPAAPSRPFRFLVVSRYNYFRNFETVLRAFAQMRSNGAGGRCRLLLTTDLRPGLRLGGYDTTRACRLLSDLDLGETVTTLGSVPYQDLPALYRSVDAVICPAYTESFSHTVIEAMAMGLPVIASDITVHREVAGDAALFFSPLEPANLVERCYVLMQDAALRARLQAAGWRRVQDFSWRRHFEELFAAAAEVARR